MLKLFVAGALFASTGVFAGPPLASGPTAPEDDNGNEGDSASLLSVNGDFEQGNLNAELQQAAPSAQALCGAGFVNVAPFAEPSGSGGGAPGGSTGPSNMNDLQDCNYYWPSGSLATIQYNWAETRSLEKFVIITQPFCANGQCGLAGSGRGVASGTVQYWNGASWVTDGSFGGQTSQEINYNFVTQPLVTDAIRVINIATHNCGQNSNPTIYEWSVCEAESCGCPEDSFLPGDRVVRVGTELASGPPVGTQGTVICEKSSGPLNILVAWDNFETGHANFGICQCRDYQATQQEFLPAGSTNGWWVPCADVREKQEPCE